jgi:hypothetical protein
MLSWISGARNPETNDADGRKRSNIALDRLIFVDISTFEPITPAPVFAVRAFKQVLFGTPQPSTPAPVFISNGAKPKDANGKVQRRQLFPSEVQSKREKQPEDANTSISADVRQKPQGILMTPGTAAGRRKQVKFGEQVLDNESKRSKYSKSGLPDNFPGKFPSPWTPKMTPAITKIESAMTSSRETPADNFNAFDQVTLTESHPKTPSRSKDDADVTLDLSLPRSASGRYWKDQYDSYSAKSESEAKRLIVKHKVAKDYARIKDEEAMGLKAQLDSEQRKRQKREKSLERQVKDMRERLRAALAENAKMSAEVSSLRAELAGLPTRESKDKAATSAADGLAKFPTEVSVKSPGEINRLRRRPNFSTTTLGLDLEDIWLDDDADYEDNRRTRLPRRSKGQALSKTPEKEARHVMDKVPANSASKADFVPRLKRTTANSPLASKSPNIELAPNLLKLNDVVIIRTLKGRSTPDVSASVTKVSNDIPSTDGTGLMAVQPATPLGSARRKAARTPDSRKLDGKRLDDAKARVAARRRRRENRSVSR